MPRSASWEKKGPPPSLEYLPASSVTPIAPSAPAEPARTRAQRAHEAAAARMRMLRKGIGGRARRLDPPAGKMPSVRKLRAPRVSTLPVLGIVLAAGLLTVEYSSQATQWAVLTDELQHFELATSTGEAPSPV